MASKELSKKHKENSFISYGSWYPELGRQVAKITGLKVASAEPREFPNSERYFRFSKSVRNDDIYAIQPIADIEGVGSVNDGLFELIAMADAAKRASAESFTAVVPCFPYARQDRKARGREPIMAAAAIAILQEVGVDRIVSVDIHSQQIQGNFDGPFDHLTAEKIIRKCLEQTIKDNQSDYVIVSPDAGRFKESEEYASRLGVKLAHIPKERDKTDPSKIKRSETIDGVGGKKCIIIDDMIDTAGTIVSAAETLKRSGAKKIAIAATHGIFSGPALERLNQLDLNGNRIIDKVIVTDTVPQSRSIEALGKNLVVLDIAPLIGAAVVEMVRGGSISKLFKERNYK